MAVTTVTIAALGAKRIDVTWTGKAGTFCLMVAFPLFLLSSADGSWSDAAELGAWVAGLPGLVLSYVAAAMYIPIALEALHEGRAARSSDALADQHPTA